ncbi:MAG: ABC transporter ATP-binding protein [bacterium]|nr:MAG: ABC transporter ATP-binding protein [bacterium]
MDVLRVEDLRKSFRHDMSLRRREVLHGVSFEAIAGEILGFLGPNGAGKTTTIKIILGLLRADSGDVRLFGRPAGERAVRARIGFLPENPYVFPHLSLIEFLEFCGHMTGMRGTVLRARIEEVIWMVGLESSRARLKTYSKGQLQRVGLAQAILHDPELLILDEPFSGLDPLGRIKMRDILVGLRNQGKTIFFSSHILPDVETMCDRTCIIREGLIVRCVGIDDLIRIGESRVEMIVRGCPPECFDTLDDYLESKNSTGDEFFLLVKKQDYVRTVVQVVYNSGGEILKIVNQHPSLEEVFLNEMLSEFKQSRVKTPEEEHTFIGF